MSKYNLTDLAEGMGYKEYEDAEEANRLEKHPERDTIKKIQALMAKEKSLEEDAVDLAVEASQAKAGIKEARVDRDVEERIEGLLHRELKRKFLFAFEDLYSDLIEEDPFHAEDVINHLNNEMHKHLSSFQNTGDKFAGMEESFDSLAKKLDKQKGIDKDEAAKIAGSIAAKKAAGAGKGPTAKQKKRMSEGILKDVVLAIIKDTNATNPEVQMYIDSLTNDIKLNGKEAYANYEIDDYIEDFKEYISNKALQEHFKRFK